MTKIVMGPVGQIWILAALSLPYNERIEAFDQIADLLGTSYSRVQSAATQLKAKQHAEKVAKGQPEGPRPPFSKNAYIPSQLRKLTLAELMAGRAK